MKSAVWGTKTTYENPCGPVCPKPTGWWTNQHGQHCGTLHGMVEWQWVNYGSFVIHHGKFIWFNDLGEWHFSGFIVVNHDWNEINMNNNLLLDCSPLLTMRTIIAKSCCQLTKPRKARRIWQITSCTMPILSRDMDCRVKLPDKMIWKWTSHKNVFSSEEMFLVF